MINVKVLLVVSVPAINKSSKSTKSCFSIKKNTKYFKTSLFVYVCIFPCTFCEDEKYLLTLTCKCTIFVVFSFINFSQEIADEIVSV